MRVISIAVGIGVLLAAAVALAVLGNGSAAAAPQAGNVAIVAYSTPREAFGKITKAFTDTQAGRGVSFTQSYGSSGEQTRAVIGGLSADVVALSLQPDMSTLVNAGKVSRTWKNNKYKGMVTHSIVVFVVRDGNPKKIYGWGDLVKSDIEIITPNPLTSGGARWNVMAAYGAQRKQGKTHKQAVAYLGRLFRHVPVLDKSAREALQTFAGGKGDVLITYENEAIFANKKGVRTDFVRPRETLLMEHPIALTKSGQSKREARAFLRYLWTPAAQRIFAENGYRPIVKSVRRRTAFPNPKGMFKIGYVGGWPKVQRQFFGTRNGIVTRIVNARGG
jgi:sulfate/thiosulfate-binding protein